MWTCILGLARADVDEVQDRSETVGTDKSQKHDYAQSPLGVTMNYHSRTERFAASLPKDRALAISERIDGAERITWTVRVRGTRAGMAMH